MWPSPWKIRGACGADSGWSNWPSTCGTRRGLWPELPGFAAAAVLSLAIGIGATTALFSVLQHVAWQPLPYRDPGKLAIVWNLDPRLANPQSPASYPDWQDWRRQAKGFAVVAAFRNRPGFIKAAEESPQVELHEVSADFLPLLGVAPALGRFWTR